MSSIPLILLLASAVLGMIVVPACVVLCIECIAALFHRRRDIASGSVDAVRSVVLIPAHNEEASIGATLASVLPQLASCQRVLVVADNCDDATAAIARGVGVDVVERHDATRRGKGFALACGVDQLRSDPPEVVIIVDADTRVMPGTIAALGRDVVRTGQPSQAINLLSPPQLPTSRDWISTFAFRVRNLVRPMGQAVLGVPCQLMGNGMAVPWGALENMDLASANIVEDMQLGIDLTVAGYSPRLNLDGCVTGVFPNTVAAATTQRRRWEHGHLLTILQQVPRIFWASLCQRRLGLLWFAFDTAVPPLALVVSLWSVLAVLTLTDGVVAHIWWPALVSLALAVMLLISVGSAWFRFATDIPGTAILMVPVYVLRKLPMYAAFLVQRQRTWIRTERSKA